MVARLFFFLVCFLKWDCPDLFCAEAPNNIPVLRVYTTKNFMKGPGQALKARFEAAHGCKIDYYVGTNPTNVVATLGRLREKPDVLVEVTYDCLQSLPEAKKKDLFLVLELDRALSSLTLGIPWKDPYVLPISYTLLSFVYHEKAFNQGVHQGKGPQSFEELLNIPGKIVIMDPRTSSPGFGLLMWIKQVYGDKAKAYWKRLKPKILTVTKGWSEAYALFLKEEAPVVLSYTTSPAYHHLEENRHDIHAASFREGHYLDIYTAVILKTTQQPFLAKKFLELLISQPVQKDMVYRNWAYPVVKLTEPLPKPFDKTVTVLPPLTPKAIQLHKQAWIQEWLEALS
jgi:thiamine transport system substrate-binding protein